MERSLHKSLLAASLGAAANGCVAAVSPDALRATGNGTFAFLAVPLAGSARMSLCGRRAFWAAYLGAHGVHASLLARVARRDGCGAFSSTSRAGGTIGYATITALTAAAVYPGPPPSHGYRRHLQHTGHNVLLGMYAFTILHGYLAKGRDLRAYGPLALAWLAAARGMNRSWRR